MKMDTIEDNPNLPELKEIRETWRNYKEKNKRYLGVDEYESRIANK